MFLFLFYIILPLLVQLNNNISANNNAYIRMYMHTHRGINNS